MTLKNLYQTLAFVLLMASCKSENKQQTQVLANKPIPVLTEQILSVPSNGEISISGNIEGNKTVRLGFMVAGKINNITAREGQAVKQGQLLASLDPESYQIAKELVDIQVNQTQEEYNRLKIIHDRKS